MQLSTLTHIFLQSNKQCSVIDGGIAHLNAVKNVQRKALQILSDSIQSKQQIPNKFFIYFNISRKLNRSLINFSLQFILQNVIKLL